MILYRLSKSNLVFHGDLYKLLTEKDSTRDTITILIEPDYMICAVIGISKTIIN
jgi:hypothetical protein